MIKRLVLISALAVGTASVAHADSINGAFSVYGNDTFTSSSVTFSSSTISGGLSGTFATYLTDGDPLTFLETTLPYTQGMNTPPLSVYPTGIVPIFTVAGNNGVNFTFNMTSYDAAYTSGIASCPGACLGLTAYGYITSNDPALTTSGNGYASTTLQLSPTAVPPYTYSGVVTVPSAATPEPSSLALLGTGLLGVVGIARRKFAV